MKQESHKYTFIISGGGTGGHIFPAIAIANEIRSRLPESTILFVGAKDRMEMQRVPDAGYKIEGLWISGIQRSKIYKNILFPFKVISSVSKCRRILRENKPDAVIGTGGFASGPLLYAAQSKKIPTLIQEQNSFPGITNKLLGKKANKICIAYENLERFFPKENMVMTGNPIRKNIAEKFENKVEKKKSKLNLLVLGGSLGARAINNAIHSNYESLIENGYNILWQCGTIYHTQLKQQLEETESLKLLPFINDMAAAYQKADVIVSRAGAGTISELCLIGKPTILIPSPNVAEDHQTKNAEAISNKNAAILIKEDQIEELKLKLLGLAKNKDQRRELGENIKKLARPNATEEIVDQLFELIK